MIEFKDYENDLKKLAWRFSSDWDQYEEMFSICQEVFCQIVPKFCENRSNFKTYLIKCARNRMIDEIRSIKTKNTYIREIEIIELNQSDNTWNPERLTEVNNLLKGMSEEAQWVVSMILSSPEEILGGAKTHSPKQLRGQLFRLLRNRGWSEAPIYRTIKEIKTTVRSM